LSVLGRERIRKSPLRLLRPRKKVRLDWRKRKGGLGGGGKKNASHLLGKKKCRFCSIKKGGELFWREKGAPKDRKSGPDDYVVVSSFSTSGKGERNFQGEKGMSAEIQNMGKKEESEFGDLAIHSEGDRARKKAIILSSIKETPT